MLKKVIFSLSLLLFVKLTFGQNNWKSGYIIKNTNDTIFGLVDSKSSLSNVKVCSFKQHPEDNVQEFSPEEIKGFRFTEGKYFVSKTIDGFNNGEPVFLEYVLKGQANLYHLTTSKGDVFFIEKDEKLYELKNTESEIRKNNTVYVQEKKEYIGTLSYVFQDADITAKVQTTSLQKKSLVNLTKKYHETVCFDEECIIYERNETKISVNYIPYAGLAVNRIFLGGIIKSEYGISYNAGVAVEFENIFDWLDNLTFSTGAGITSLSKYTLYNEDEFEVQTVFYEGSGHQLRSDNTFDVDVKGIFLDVPVMLNYYFSNEKWQPFIGAGLITSYKLTQNDDFETIPKFYYGLTAKFGLNYYFTENHGLALSLNWKHLSSTNVNMEERFVNTGFGLNVGYIF